MLAFVELHFYPMSTKQRAGHKTCFLFWLFCSALCQHPISALARIMGDGACAIDKLAKLA